MPKLNQPHLAVSHAELTPAQIIANLVSNISPAFCYPVMKRVTTPLDCPSIRTFYTVVYQNISSTLSFAKTTIDQKRFIHFRTVTIEIREMQGQARSW